MPTPPSATAHHRHIERLASEYRHFESVHETPFISRWIVARGGDGARFVHRNRPSVAMLAPQAAPK